MSMFRKSGGQGYRDNQRATDRDQPEGEGKHRDRGERRGSTPENYRPEHGQRGRHRSGQ